MNLKDAFRYQNFLERTMRNAAMAAKRPDVALRTTKFHARSKAHSDAQDETENIESEAAYEARHVFDLMARLIQEREALSEAIFRAKTVAAVKEGTDIDTMTEANKFRQLAAGAMREVLSATKPGKRVEKGTAYCFNAEGNQTPYTYDVTVTTEALFNRKEVQGTIHALLRESDACSAAIDKALVNAEVEYEAPWPVTATFNEVIATVVEETQDAAGETAGN